MFSIVIPIYNVQDYLKECLKSIICQNKSNIEVLLVDDGSTDHSSQIAQNYADQYPYIFKYLKKENGGLSDARNYAISFAKNEYIFFIDSDDVITDNSLDALEKIINDKHPDLIIFDYFNKWEIRKEVVHISNQNSGFINKKDYLLMNPAAWNKVIKTEIIKTNQIYFPKGLWYEDRATTANYINFCQSIYYLHTPLYYYRQRENSIMKQKDYNPKMLDILTAMEYFDNQVSDTDFKDEKEYLFISNLLFQNALRMIPFMRVKEIRQCYLKLKNHYPNWKKNKYFHQQSKGYKMLCYLISMKCYRLSKILIDLKMKG